MVDFTIGEDGSVRTGCPMHPGKDDCAIVVPNGDYFNVKLHGSIHLNHSTGEPEDFELEDAKDFIITLFKAIPAFSVPLPLGPNIELPNPEPVTKPETPQAKFYTHNYFQVMLQGTQFGNYVLVNSPRFGPLDPNQAINLAVYLRLHAEMCENLNVSFDELWEEMKESKIKDMHNTVLRLAKEAGEKEK